MTDRVDESTAIILLGKVDDATAKSLLDKIGDAAVRILVATADASTARISDPLSRMHNAPNFVARHDR